MGITASSSFFYSLHSSSPVSMVLEVASLLGYKTWTESYLLVYFKGSFDGSEQGFKENPLYFSTHPFLYLRVSYLEKKFVSSMRNIILVEGVRRQVVLQPVFYLAIRRGQVPPRGVVPDAISLA